MDNDIQGFINEIKYPDYCLKTFDNKIKKSIENNDLQFFKEKGEINFGKSLKKIDKITFFYLNWIADINEVIENLNLIIGDLRLLGKSHIMFIGSPRIRFYLLLRLFFYEFYRFREIFNSNIKVFEIMGYINKEGILSIRKNFNEEFKTSISIRHNLVHKDINWKGQEHFDMQLISIAKDSGFMIIDKKTGEEIPVKKILEPLCIKYSDIFLVEGQRMSKILQYIINTTSKFIFKENKKI